MGTELAVVFDFLRRLKAHNERPWFEAHRADYERARLAFEDFVQDLILRFDPIEPLAGSPPKDFIMRIHRDVRFSRDKSPYRTNFAAGLVQGGRRATRLSYYVHLEPDGSFLAGGVYMPDAAQLKRIRAAIADDASDLRSILAAKPFKRFFGGLSGERLKTAPKGYPADHPDIDLLRHTQFLAMHHVTEDQACAPGFARHAVESFSALKRFSEYFNHVLGLGQHGAKKAG